MPDNCDTTCSVEPRIDAIDKKLAVMEERLSNSTKLLTETCTKLEEAKDAIITYNVEMKHTSEELCRLRQEDIKELRKCISMVKRDVSDLKVSAARAGGKWGAITALVTALVSAGGFTMLMRFFA